jgi:hypothetical protein
MCQLPFAARQLKINISAMAPGYVKLSVQIYLERVLNSAQLNAELAHGCNAA